MTAGRFLGFERVEAARFALLLSIPAILGAGSLAGYELYRAGNAVLGYSALVGAALAFITALVAIVLMMGWLKRASFTPFVVYRLLLGAALLWWVNGGSFCAVPGNASGPHPAAAAAGAVAIEVGLNPRLGRRRRHAQGLQGEGVRGHHLV